jgi:BNR repeat-like domain
MQSSRTIPPQFTRRRFLQVGGSVPGAMFLRRWAFAEDANAPEIIADTILVNGISLKTSALPESLTLDRNTGLVFAKPIIGQVIYRSPTHAWEVRGTITPKGDFLVMSPIGGHYGPRPKVNYLAAFRSPDRGKTWNGPTDPTKTQYSMHGFIPLIPQGTKRIYAFGTQAIPELQEGLENAPIGFRFSDDDGYSWSDVQLIKPENDPGFKGMSVMRMCETASGVWLLGSHEGLYAGLLAPQQGGKLLSTRQYILRSADQGKTWTAVPHPRPNGWYVPGKPTTSKWYMPTEGRMDEGRPISIGGDKVLFLVRTPEGHLWASWSDDAGKTWSAAKPTSLVHPDAPPMLFHMPDGKTLACFHHNSYSDWNRDRSELWVSFSSDGGHHWTEPRFVLANALTPNIGNGFYDWACSYLDAFCDGDTMHMFFAHRWKIVTHMTVKAADLYRMPTKSALQNLASHSSDGI